MAFSDDQIAELEDRLANGVQRPLTALQTVFHQRTADDRIVLQAIGDLERLMAWVRGLRASPDQRP